MVAPVLVIAVGNPSRGDDAIGPLLAERLDAAAIPGVEVIVDYQLQVEHALDLEGRELAVFVDAAVGIDVPFTLLPVTPAAGASCTTHALSPAAVLHAFHLCSDDDPPPAWILAVRGARFELGEPLSGTARADLEQAWSRLERLATTRRVS